MVILILLNLCLTGFLFLYLVFAEKDIRNSIVEMEREIKNSTKYTREILEIYMEEIRRRMERLRK